MGHFHGVLRRLRAKISIKHPAIIDWRERPMLDNVK
jgi:hypothetical protein